ncbi:hypothetical protein ASG78_00675 [Nostocoides sp. Soil756]|nr:hypothetical protein ASG78_00675 [Tetrasphaera sp. Soil756]
MGAADRARSGAGAGPAGREARSSRAARSTASRAAPTEMATRVPPLPSTGRRFSRSRRHGVASETAWRERSSWS